MSAVTAYRFKVADGANVVMNVRQDSRFNHGTTEFLWSNAAVKTFYNNRNDAVVIGSGASFKLNPDQAVYNTKGFSFSDKANMIIAENANVEMNMGRGNSAAILAPRQLIVKKGATLNIKTQEDNNGSYAWGDDNNGNHVAPISIGNLKAANGDSSFTIENGATVRIVRSATNRNSYGPMISFGSTGENPYCNYYFNVEDGATLDLQDAGQAGSWHHQGTEWESNYLGDKSQLPLNGMIVMYGIRSEDHLNFGNIKYVNLQRSGQQHGLLIRLEGGHNISGSNAATITGQDVPLAQWQASNHSKKADYTWYINGLKTENKMGNWSYDYNIKGRRPGDVPNRREADTDYHFNQTTGTVSFADVQNLSKHQNFNNNFSWWKAQRISFGSDLLPDSKKYSVTSAAPNTSKATTIAEPNTSGQITFIFKDGSETTLKNVPVVVLTANAGKVGKVRAGHAEDMPTAAYETDISQVNKFGIKSISWKTMLNISQANPAAKGVTTVNYSDGTSQDVNVLVDVLEVTNGKDHKNQGDIYKGISREINVTAPDGSKSSTKQNVNFARNRYTDLALRPGQKSYISYGDWQVDGNDSYARHNLPSYAHEEAEATSDGAAYTLGKDANGQYVPARTGIKVTDHDQVINVTYKDTRTDAEKYLAHVNKGLNTHVNATIHTPSLDKKQISFSWTKDGQVIAQPANISWDWTKNPDTSKAGNTTGTVTISFADGSHEDAAVPVSVATAKAVKGLSAHQGEEATIPTAKQATNTIDVDHFGISSVVWKQKPSVAKADPAAPGMITVYYNDGTNQDVAVTIDVWKTDKGEDHHDDHDIYRNVNRTIHANKPSGTETTIQTVNFARTRYTDLADGQKKVTYSTWRTVSPAKDWAHYTAPSVAGYVASPKEVAEQAVTPATKDAVVEINYAASEQVQKINYVDVNDHRHVLAQDQQEGKTDQKASYLVKSSLIPKGWVLANGQKSAIDFTFTANSQPLLVYLTHGMSTNDKGDSKKVTRNIYKRVNGITTPVTTQSTVIYRATTIDQVTGKVVKYGNWQAGKMAKYDAPVVVGYVVTNPDAAPEVTVDGSQDKLADVIFNYTAAAQKHTVNFVDNADKKTVVSHYDIAGVTGKSVNLAIESHVPAGWKIAAGQTINDVYTFPAEDQGPTVVYVEHGTKTIENGDSETVSRDIYTKFAGQSKKVDTQQVKLYRDVTVDDVTGQKTYGNGKENTMAAYPAPTISGYTITNPNAGSAVKVDDSQTKLADVVFNYIANEQTQNFNYVDKTSGKTVGTASETGKTGSQSNFDALSKMPNGYKLAPGQTANISFTFQPDAVPITIYVVSLTDAEQNHAATDDKIITHVGADVNSPSMNPSKVHLIWKDNQGNVLSEQDAPKNYKVDWKTVPSTEKVTSEQNMETGVLTIIFQDKSSEDVNVPVEVKGAKAINGAKVKQGAAVPAASGSVDTSDVKQFDLKDVTWSKAPSTATPGANVPGTARVNYQDGTYQDVDVTIDVFKVEDGHDHKDNSNLYR